LAELLPLEIRLGSEERTPRLLDDGVVRHASARHPSLEAAFELFVGESVP
jgi:hypothetical protein